jgi:hypothetical protein
MDDFTFTFYVIFSSSVPGNFSCSGFAHTLSNILHTKGKWWLVFPVRIHSYRRTASLHAFALVTQRWGQMSEQLLHKFTSADYEYNNIQGYGVVQSGRQRIYWRFAVTYCLIYASHIHVIACCFHFFLLGLYFDNEDGGIIFYRNVSNILPVYMVSDSRR